MKYYHAVFKTSTGAVEVEFPDLQGCVTFGKDWENALDQTFGRCGLHRHFGWSFWACDVEMFSFVNG